MSTSNVEIYLYVELLLNIRSVSVLGTIYSPTGERLSATLSTNINKVHVECGHKSASVLLPTKFFNAQTTTTSFDGDKPKTFRSRLPIEELDAVLTSDSVDTDQQIPWSALNLANDCSFACQNCNQDVIPKWSIHWWKDLPSANWAEMMDFWHCHKPPGPSGNSDDPSVENKGYAAGNTIKAERNVGLVDISSFLLHHDDCVNTYEVCEQSQTFLTYYTSLQFYLDGAEQREGQERKEAEAARP